MQRHVRWWRKRTLNPRRIRWSIDRNLLLVASENPNAFFTISERNQRAQSANGISELFASKLQRSCRLRIMNKWLSSRRRRIAFQPFVTEELACLTCVISNGIANDLFRVCRAAIRRRENPSRHVPMKRCHECGRKFGLIRHRLGFHQFCTKWCLQRYGNRFLERGRNWWLSLLPRERTMSPVRMAAAQPAKRPWQREE
jgi:hypothetical protein